MRARETDGAMTFSILYESNGRLNLFNTFFSTFDVEFFFAFIQHFFSPYNFFLFFLNDQEQWAAVGAVVVFVGHAIFNY